MELDKKEIIEMAKERGVEVAEEAVKEILHLALDIVCKMVDASENKYDDMIKAALEGKLRASVDAIDISI